MDKKERHAEYMREWGKTPAGLAYTESQREYRKHWREENKEQFQSVKKHIEDAVRMEALVHYSQSDPPKCSICGAIDELNLRLSPVLPKQDPYWMRRNNWPPGFRVLCFPCVKDERRIRLAARQTPIWLNTETGKHFRDTRDEVPCSQCGKLLLKMQCHMKYGEHFCDTVCHGQWRSSNIRGISSTRWKGGKQEYPCSECSKPVLRYQVVASKSANVFCGPPCRGAWAAKHRTGEKIYNWAGGYEPYYGPTWLQSKRAARKRDNNTCQRCGKTNKEVGRALDVHHVIKFREFGANRHLEANDLSNLVCYCASCHKTVEEADGVALRKGNTAK
ncbi:MAG: hypothetical protein NVS1B11_36270 [Terriglobales bacterium]